MGRYIFCVFQWEEYDSVADALTNPDAEVFGTIQEAEQHAMVLAHAQTVKQCLHPKDIHSNEYTDGVWVTVGSWTCCIRVLPNPNY